MASLDEENQVESLTVGRSYSKSAQPMNAPLTKRKSVQRDFLKENTVELKDYLIELDDIWLPEKDHQIIRLESLAQITPQKINIEVRETKNFGFKN